MKKLRALAVQPRYPAGAPATGVWSNIFNLLRADWCVQGRAQPIPEFRQEESENDRLSPKRVHGRSRRLFPARKLRTGRCGTLAAASRKGDNGAPGASQGAADYQKDDEPLPVPVSEAPWLTQLATGPRIDPSGPGSSAFREGQNPGTGSNTPARGQCASAQVWTPGCTGTVRRPAVNGAQSRRSGAGHWRPAWLTAACLSGCSACRLPLVAGPRVPARQSPMTCCLRA